MYGATLIDDPSDIPARRYKMIFSTLGREVQWANFHLPLSLAYPMMVSLGYVIILAVSSFVLPDQFPGERMSTARYAGAGLMLAGLWLLVR